MSRGQFYIGDDLSVKKVRPTFGVILGRVFLGFVASLALTAVYYLLFSAFVSTDVEKKLARENKVYSKLYPQMQERRRLIEDVTSRLSAEDDAIYQQIFHNLPPKPGVGKDMNAAFESDSMPDKDLVLYAEEKIGLSLAGAKLVEDNFSAVFERLAGGSAIPPLRTPLGKLSSAQVGASSGMKVNPFYKVESRHDGLDIIAAQGTPVLATADGIVVEVHYSGRGLGNEIKIDHGNSYVTRYCHLANISVRRGARVKAGARIASVGISGNTFIPHLHYEVLKDGSPMPPESYFFASLTPAEYAEVAYMALNTGQSLD